MRYISEGVASRALRETIARFPDRRCGIYHTIDGDATVEAISYMRDGEPYCLIAHVLLACQAVTPQALDRADQRKVSIFANGVPSSGAALLQRANIACDKGRRWGDINFSAAAIPDWRWTTEVPGWADSERMTRIIYDFFASNREASWT